MIEITYLGHAAFKIRASSTTLIIDPFDPKKVGGLLWQKQAADIVCLTHQHDDHNYLKGVPEGVSRDQPFVISGPGEYEVAGVSVVGAASFHDQKQGAERGLNTIYKISVEGITLVHLGDLGHLLSEEQIKNLEMVDILLVPCGGIYTIDAEQAAKVVDQLEPYLVVPMHYGIAGTVPADEWKLAPVEEFLKALQVEKPELVSKLKIKSRVDLPKEREVVVMKTGE